MICLMILRGDNLDFAAAAAGRCQGSRCRREGAIITRGRNEGGDVVTVVGDIQKGVHVFGLVFLSSIYYALLVINRSGVIDWILVSSIDR